MIENVIIAPVTNSTAPNRGKGGELLLPPERWKEGGESVEKEFGKHSV